MKRLKGPELKLSELKVPPALRDLYLDLRDRRLLPLIGLILVAILATPFLLGGGGGALPEPAPGPTAGGSPQEASLTVVPAEPGLREPSKRLAGRPSKNPFKPHYTAPLLNPGSAPVGEPSSGGSGSSSAPVESGSGNGSSVEGGSTPPAPAPAPVPSESGGGGGSHSGGGSGGHSTESEVPQGGTLYTLAVTVQITRIETKSDGSLDKKGPTLYKDVLAPTPLPGKKTPVITYLGMGSKHHEPLFLVSNEVTSVFGEANCISGAGSCQLLVLEKGFPVTFVYGDNNVRYKINLLKAEPVVNGHS
ncbi:MAG TPA: hypothetical protein VFL77_02660 [Solirubrobacterales bacterium]|nr:hypothetical protein [Solirubrobacterales bacterium]